MPLEQPTPADVRTVITTALDDATITAMIADAALIADGCPMVATYDAARQAAVVKWIAAHLIAARTGLGGQLTQKALGDASESYSSAPMGAQLAGSRYGQQALALDTSGCLSQLGMRRVRLQVL